MEKNDDDTLCQQQQGQMLNSDDGPTTDERQWSLTRRDAPVMSDDVDPRSVLLYDFFCVVCILVYRAPC